MVDIGQTNLSATKNGKLIQLDKAPIDPLVVTKFLIAHSPLISIIIQLKVLRKRKDITKETTNWTFINLWL